jgi:uncharacterized membrane protein SpoIIM required for sporulation
MGVMAQVVSTVKRVKGLLTLVALLYILSYLAGWYLIGTGNPSAAWIAERIRQTVLTQRPFTTVIGALRGGNLLEAILFTFLFNLANGAFASTTLPGIIPLLGALFTVGITVVRGFIIGLTYPEVLASSTGGFVVGMGTLLLELGAYVFSGAAGINIALAPLMPQREGTQSRLAAFKAAWKDAAHLYVIVIVLLALGAIWEMTGLFLLIRPS